MKVATLEYQNKQIRLEVSDDLTNGGVYIETLEIDGQDCSNALHIGNLYDLFDELLNKQKVEA